MALLCLLATIGVAACNPTIGTTTYSQPVPGGNVAQGRVAITRYGCGSCHAVAGVPGAQGLVGPPLTGIGQRAYVAGMLSNTPDNMVRWIMEPQAIVPGNAMPNLGVSEADARDITAFLYTTR